MLRILVLCLAAALICTALRGDYPQIAVAIALAAGVAALLLSTKDLSRFAEAIQRLEDYGEGRASGQFKLLKICGICMIAEFASDICRDAGEASLAHRIEMGVKLGVTATALPIAMEIMEHIAAMIE